MDTPPMENCSLDFIVPLHLGRDGVLKALASRPSRWPGAWILNVVPSALKVQSLAWTLVALLHWLCLF